MNDSRDLARDLEHAKRLIAQRGVPSVSYVQRHMGIRYSYAQQLVAALNSAGTTGVRTAEAPRFHIAPGFDGEVLFTHAPDGEWVKWADVAHTSGVSASDGQTFPSHTPMKDTGRNE